MRRIYPLIATLLILFALVPQGLQAAGASRPEPHDAPREWSFELRVALGRITNVVRSVLEKTGCAIDPLGLCAPTPQQDTGCAIDPAGGSCHP